MASATVLRVIAPDFIDCPDVVIDIAVGKNPGMVIHAQIRDASFIITEGPHLINTMLSRKRSINWNR